MANSDNIADEIRSEMTVSNSGKVIKYLMTTVVTFTFLAAMTFFNTQQNTKDIGANSGQIDEVVVKLADTAAQAKAFQDFAREDRSRTDDQIAIILQTLNEIYQKL